MSSPRKKRDNLSVLKVYLSFIHINTTLKKMAHGIHDIKVILMYTNTHRYNKTFCDCVNTHIEVLKGVSKPYIYKSVIRKNFILTVCHLLNLQNGEHKSGWNFCQSYS